MPQGLVFICLGNSCRSIMAEALARCRYPDIRVASAGFQPLGTVARETLVVLAETGVPTEGLWSKGLGDISLEEFGLAVNLTAHDPEPYLPEAFHGRVLNHPVADPFGGPIAAYRQTRDAISRFIAFDLPPHLIDL
jgi:protein-tyrosine-phosphatase